MATSILLLLSLLSVCAAQTFFPVSNSALYFSRYNWAFTSAAQPTALTSNNGAYIKVKFTGTSIALGINTSFAPAMPFMNLLFTIDDGPMKEVAVPPRSEGTLPLASGLTAGTHSLVLYVYNSLQSSDRWTVGVGNSAILGVRGVIVDSGAQLQPLDTLPRHILVYGDSITEGVQAECQPGGDLESNAATKTWAMALAAGLQTEISVVGYGRLGWTIPGNGNVPPVFTPGAPDSSSWNMVLAKFPRNFSIAPDAIVIGHGTNDGSAPPSTVQRNAQGWLSAVRQAAPSSAIFVCVPFGGFQKSALEQATANYIAASGDTNVFFIDLGAQAAYGTAHWGASAESCDGIHPLAYRHGQLGSMLAVQVAKKLKW
eukprot:m.19058 g.19058  ORF g.19058 m.19058 type:complete len:371 (+) comp7493_c0_seq1:24-1136(+)